MGIVLDQKSFFSISSPPSNELKLAEFLHPLILKKRCLERKLNKWKTLIGRLSKMIREVKMLTPTRHEESQTNPSQTTRPKQPKRPRPKQPKNECPSKPLPNKDHRSKQPRNSKLTTLKHLEHKQT